MPTLPKRGHTTVIRALITALLAAVALAAGTPAASPSPSPSASASAGSSSPAGGRPHNGSSTIYSLLPLGDSITSGTGSTDGTGYRTQLAALMPQTTYVGTQGADPLLHEGRPGWTIDQLADIAQGTVALTLPAYVLVHAGTNDDGRDRTAPQMLASMGRLLDAIALGSPRTIVLVAQIPLTPYNTPTQQAEQAAFNAGLPALAAARQRVRIVDMTATHISTDRVHPDDDGYAWMAARWAQALPKVRAYA
jgi:lysophospholipase L1-like esterase